MEAPRGPNKRKKDGLPDAPLPPPGPPPAALSAAPPKPLVAAVVPAVAPAPSAGAPLLVAAVSSAGGGAGSASPSPALRPAPAGAGGLAAGMLAASPAPRSVPRLLDGSTPGSTRKRWWGWKYMRPVEGDNDRHRCVLCEQVGETKAFKSTHTRKGMEHHLIVKHNMSLPGTPTRSGAAAAGRSSAAKARGVDQELLEDLQAKAFVMADIPLHVTQSQNFVEFLRSVNDGYHAPARDALLAAFERLFTRMREKTLMTLRTADFMALAVDIVPAITGDATEVVMAHFIDTKWQLRSLPVAVCSDDETGLAAGGASGSRGRTCDLLRDMLPDLIHRGAIALATDSAMSLSGMQAPQKERHGVPESLRNLGHLVNSWVTRALHQPERGQPLGAWAELEPVADVRRLVNVVTASPALWDLVLRKQAEAKVKEPLPLLTEVEAAGAGATAAAVAAMDDLNARHQLSSVRRELSRWPATWAMLRRALQLRAVLAAVADEDPSVPRVSPAVWAAVHGLVVMLEPFVDAVRELLADGSPALPSAWKWLVLLRRACRMMQDAPPPPAAAPSSLALGTPAAAADVGKYPPVVHNARSRLLAEMDQDAPALALNDFLRAVTVADPRHKSLWWLDNTPEGEEEATRAFEALRAVLEWQDSIAPSATVAATAAAAAAAVATVTSAPPGAAAAAGGGAAGAPIVVVPMESSAAATAVSGSLMNALMARPPKRSKTTAAAAASAATAGSGQGVPGAGASLGGSGSALTAAEEVKAYRHAGEPREGGASALEWWAANEAHFPRVARFARGVLGLPAAAAAPPEHVLARCGVELGRMRGAAPLSRVVVRRLFLRHTIAVHEPPAVPQPLL